MRLNRLELTRYGIFTDYEIPFGDHVPNTPDLHIIYGPNEAGKSTTLAAFLDLVFGIETRSKYGFLHSFSTMRIGADISINGAARQFVRVKNQQNSLLDSADRPISESTILTGLGGIDRATYGTMFSLDDDTLEKGGESILASKGDLGQLLFSASAGLSDLNTKLESIRAAVESFYKVRARSGELSELKKKLLNLRKQREDIDTAASAYAKLVEEQDRSAAQYAEAMKERSGTQVRLEELRRQAAALPRRAALRALRERLNPLVSIPSAPKSWLGELPKLHKDEIELLLQAESIEADVKQLTEELNGAVSDERVLSLKERIDQLTDLRARYMTADKDIPERRLQLRDAETAIAGIIKRLECDPNADAKSLLLGAKVTGGFRDLIERWSGVDANAATAEEELSEARRRLKYAEANAKALNGDANPISAPLNTQLVSVLSRARASDHPARQRLAARMDEENREVLARHMRALHPWTGEAGGLVDLAVPAANDLERLEKAISESQKRLDRYQETIEKLLSEEHKLTAEIDATGNVAGVVSDQKAAEIRAAREKSWANHKAVLDMASAEAFEGDLRQDDIVTNARLGNAAEVANLHQITKTLAGVKAELGEARKSQRSAADQLEKSHKELAGVVTRIAPTLPADWNIGNLRAWMDVREKAIEVVAAIKKVERDAQAAKQDRENIHRDLLDVAASAGLEPKADASEETLITLVQETLDRETELRALRSEVEACRRDSDTRALKVDKAQKAKTGWQEEWAGYCKSCWLRDRTIPSVSTLREVLKELDELRPLVDKRDGLIDRIEKMEGDQQRFTAEVIALAKILNLDITLPVLELYASLTKAVEKEKTIEVARQASESRLKEAQTRQKTISVALELHNRHKSEMLTHFAANSLNEVEGKLRSLETRREIEGQVTAAELEIMDTLGESSIQAAEAALESVDRSQIESERSELAGRLEDQDQRAQELFSESSKAADRLAAVGGDDAVARIEEQRRTTLLETTEGAMKYLRLKLGVAAAEQALRLYRDQHRSSMMNRASDAFKLISRGAYTGLTTQVDGDKEALVAVGAGGGSKIASDLSKGTRFQLYLALRVAGYQEFSQARESVPFIADDIMETFDDFRAEEAFKLFAEMAKVGQVIYLTHHRHLCAIARQVCPSVRVHELPYR